MSADAEQPADPLSGLFRRDPGEKLRRKRQLLAALHGQAQPRDDQGRFAETEGRFAETASFDGGARTPLPPPPETHGDWLGRALRDRTNDVGRHLED